MSDRLELARRWARRVLGEGDLDLEPASADASFRRYFRVRFPGGTRILMDAPPAHEDSRPFVAVAKLLRAAGVNAPAVHASDLAQGFLLLDDLGDRSYLALLDASNADVLYDDAIETLLRMQRGVPAQRVPAYDDALVARELALFGDWFLDRHLGIAVEGDAKRILDEACAWLGREFQRQPRVFVHRDYHSRNLMYVERDNPGVLDFQDAVAGPAVYDLVSLLRDVYVEWPAARVDEWADRYHARALAAGLPVARERAEFRRQLDLVGAQRHLKVAGIFCRLYHRDGKPGYLDDIPLTLRYLAAECAALEALAPLGALLATLDLPAGLAAANARVRARRANGR
ncbi:MAG: phosphotransferase [Gammaproteobacteria bacterium]|nr:phosphotransferase [Gammaproteobacteria bacterium]